MKSLKLITISIAVIATVLILLSLYFQPTTMPILRHVNPNIESESFPLSSYMMVLFSDTFDSLIKGNYNATYERLKILNAAYIPERYKFAFERFTQLLNDVSNLLANIEDILDRAEFSINLGEDAGSLIQEASIKLANANITYMELRRACEEIAKNLRLPLNEVITKLDQLGNKIEELQMRLIRLMKSIDEQRTLKDAFLTIEVSPMEVWTGGTIEVKGRLYEANGSGLIGKKVQIYIDGIKIAESTTIEEGIFESKIQLPYIYKSEISIKALFMQDEYKPTISNIVKVNLLYIEPRMVIEVNESVLPGKAFAINGKIEAEKPLPYDYIKVSWVSRSFTANVRDGHFNLALYTPDDITEGVHPLTIESPAWKIFAPVQKTIYLKVQRLPLNVQLTIPSIAFAGFPLTLNGKILYENEQFNVTIKFIFLDQTYTTNSHGEFNLNLSTPFTILTGHQNFEIYISPSIPWYRSITLKENVFILNPIAVIFPIGIFSFLTFKLSKKEKLEEIIETPENISLLSFEEKHFAPSSLKWILDLYWQAVVIVSNLTGMEMKSSTTMREYLIAVKPRLGNLKHCFEVLTNVAEKVLYSKEVSEDEIYSAKKAFEELRIASI